MPFSPTSNRDIKNNQREGVEQTTRPKVLLIIANSHGGSTISNLIIGQHHSVFSVGTLYNFPENAQFEADNYCSCGELATNCPFWTKILDLFKKEKTGNASKDLENLYRQIYKYSGRKVIIDVDHSLRQLYLASKCKNIDLRVVSIVRNKYALIHSHIRKRIKRGNMSESFISRLVLSAKLLAYWKSLHRDTLNFCESRQIPVTTISYEHLCRSPKHELKKVGQLLEIDYSEVEKKILDNQILSPAEHLFRGNRNLRSKLHDGVIVRYDDSFKNEMDTTLKLYIQLLSGFPLLFYTGWFLFRHFKNIKSSFKTSTK